MDKYKVVVMRYGRIICRLNGLVHREDGPAVIYINGRKDWWLYDKPHREDGPAIEYVGGQTKWYLNGKLHREDGPAIERSDGSKEWYLRGEILSRERHGRMVCIGG